MAKFIGKRLLMLLPVVLGVVFIVFTILRLSPTDPIRTVLGDMATEEAVQETFFEAVRKQDALMRHAKPEAWLMETLKNKIRVGSRRRALEALYFISLEQDLAQESKKLAVEDRPFGSINELLDAIGALLPPEDYRLLCRITLEGATHLEVAKELGISVWSSQKRLQRIRKKLCKQLLPNKSKKISENMSVLRF